MSTDPSLEQTPPPQTTPPFDRSDVGCMIGLALILILVPVSLYVAAPIAVLGIVAAGAAWGLMRVTPKSLRAKLGVYPTFWIWFALLVLLEISTAFYIKYRDSDAFSGPPIQRM